MIASLQTILRLPAEELARFSRFDFDPVPAEFGRVEVWEPPVPGDVYAIGADFALGLEGRDYDAACVVNTSVRPIRQVAECHVHLGEQFDRLLWPLIQFYNEAFLCGERQCGLAVMRSLLGTYGHAWMYYDRSEESRSRKITDKLGYWRGTGDICVPNLRRALYQHELVLRSRPTIDQLRRLQYAPKTAGMDPREAQDKHLGIRLKGGGSPDLVMACAYAWHGAREIPKFDRPARRYADRSLGAILGHDLLENPIDPKTAGKTWRARRRGR